MQLPTRSFRAAFSGLVAGLMFLSGCQKAAAPPDVKAAPTAPASSGRDGAGSEGGSDSTAGAPAPSIALSEEDATKLGVTSVEPKTTVWTPESSGYAVVISHEGIAQSVADLAAAQAAERHSRAALARAGQLAGGAGALSAEARENAERQAALDGAALALAERRLTTVIGEHPAWPAGASADPLGALASGRIKLVRTTFPLTSVLPQKLSALRLSLIGAAVGEHGWTASEPWAAPADPAVPGRSFFAVVIDPELSEGERLEAWTPVGAPQHGLLIPSSAVVQSEGQYWCYVEMAPGKYTRVPMDTRRPLEDGYFVNEGLSAGQRVAISAVALLLARELNPSSAAE